MSRRNARVNKKEKPIEADAPATTSEKATPSPANTNNSVDDNMNIEAVGDSNPASESEVQCGICFDAITLRGILDSCEHTFCFSCIQNWSKVTNLCPFCKQRFNKIQKKTLKGPPAKDENKKFSIKNKTQKQPDNFDIRDFLSSEDEYDGSFDENAEEDDPEYRGPLPAYVREEIRHLAQNYYRRMPLHISIDLEPIIIDDERANVPDAAHYQNGRQPRGRANNPRPAGTATRSRVNNNNRRRRALAEQHEMDDFIVPDEWEDQSAEMTYASDELEDDEDMIDVEGPRRTNTRTRPAANNSRTRKNLSNNNTRRRQGAAVNSNARTVPIAIDDDAIPILDATGDMSEADIRAIALALEEDEREQRKPRAPINVNYDSDSDEIRLRSSRRVRRT